MLEQKIAELTAAIEALTATLIAQGATPASSMPVADVEAQAPETDASSEMDPSPQDLKDATLKAARAGNKDAIRDKLAEMGVSKIQDLQGSDVGAFYKWVTGLGAN